MGLAIAISFPHRTPMGYMVVCSNPGKPADPMLPCVLRLLFEVDGISRLTLPLSYRDMQSARKHGRVPQPTVVNLVAGRQQPLGKAMARNLRSCMCELIVEKTKQHSANAQKPQEPQQPQECTVQEMQEILKLTTCDRQLGALLAQDRPAHTVQHVDMVELRCSSEDSSTTSRQFVVGDADAVYVFGMPLGVLSRVMRLLPGTRSQSMPPLHTEHRVSAGACVAEFPLKLRDDGIQKSAFRQIMLALNPTAAEDAALRCVPGDARAACIQIPCNTGKTVVGMAVMHEMLHRLHLVDAVLVLVHTRSIGSMWCENIRKMFGVDTADRLNEESVPAAPPAKKQKTLNGAEKTATAKTATAKTAKYDMACCGNALFTVATIQSLLATVPGSRRFVNKEGVRGHRTLVVIDEIQHIPAATFRRILQQHLIPIDTPYRLGLTGTINRGDGLGHVVSMLMCSSSCAPSQREGVPPLSISVTADAMNYQLLRLVRYDVLFPIVHCKPSDSSAVGVDGMDVSVNSNMGVMQRNASASMNAYVARNAVIGSSGAHARFLIGHCVLGDLMDKYAHTHVLVMTNTVKHVCKILQVPSLALFAKRARCHVCIRVGSGVVKGVGDVAAAAGISNARINASVDLEGVAASSKEETHYTITIATMQAVGEGFNDTSIDAVVFASQAMHMVQNASRLRCASRGTIAYVASVGVVGGAAAAKKDLTVIRTHMFTGGVKNDIYANKGKPFVLKEG